MEQKIDKITQMLQKNKENELANKQMQEIIDQNNKRSRKFKIGFCVAIGVFTLILCLVVILVKTPSIVVYLRTQKN